MGLDIFFTDDIRNALLAANEASSATAEAATSQDSRTLDLIAEKLRGELPEGSRALLEALHTAAVGNADAMRHYRQGYKAALTTVALAFGLSPAIIAGHQRDVLEVQARTVGETLLASKESDAPSTELRTDPSMLTDDERALVCYALENLGGKFNIRDLAEAFRGRISQRRIEQLSQQWEARGWLVAGPTRADGKRITKRLLVATTAQQSG
jgi:hypothetical protein